MPRTTVRLDRRSLLAGLGAAGLASPAAGRDADAELVAIEHRLAELLGLRAAALTARSAAEAGYLARRRERPVASAKPPRDAAERASAGRSDAASAQRLAAWAAADAALRRGLGCEPHRARLEALEREAEALVAAALARPATGAAGLAAKARLLRLTGDARFARSLAEDVLGAAVNAA